MQVVKEPARASNRKMSTTDAFLHKKHENELLLDLLSEFVSPYEPGKRDTNFDEVTMFIVFYRIVFLLYLTFLITFSFKPTLSFRLIVTAQMSFLQQEVS